MSAAMDAETFKEGSHIIKHWMTYHKKEWQMPRFTFTVFQSFKDCLSRQVAEAIRIHRVGKDHQV